MTSRSWPWLLAALLAWYEAHQRASANAEMERNQAARYDLTKYKPKPRVL